MAAGEGFELRFAHKSGYIWEEPSAETPVKSMLLVFHLEPGEPTWKVNRRENSREKFD